MWPDGSPPRSGGVLPRDPAYNPPPQAASLVLSLGVKGKQSEGI